MPKPKSNKQLRKKKGEKILPNVPPRFVAIDAFLSNGGKLPSDKMYVNGGEYDDYQTEYDFVRGNDGPDTGGQGKGMGNAMKVAGALSSMNNTSQNTNPDEGAGSGAWDTAKSGVGSVNPIAGAIVGVSSMGENATTPLLEDGTIQGDQRAEETSRAFWDPAGGVIAGLESGDTWSAGANLVGLGFVEAQYDFDGSNERDAKDHAKKLAANQKAFDSSGITQLKANGGPMDDGQGLPGQGGSLDITHYNGNTHEAGGIQVGPNSEVEDGEVRVEDYIFSDRLKPEGSKDTFADVAKKIEKRYNRKDDAATTRAMKKEFKSLMALNEVARVDAEEREAAEGQEDVFAYGGCLKRQNGGVHINPENRAEFIAAAKKRGLGTQEFAAKVMDAKDKYGDGGYIDNDGTEDTQNVPINKFDFSSIKKGSTPMEYLNKMSETRVMDDKGSLAVDRDEFFNQWNQSPSSENMKYEKTNEGWSRVKTPSAANIKVKDSFSPAFRMKDGKIQQLRKQGHWQASNPRMASMYAKSQGMSDLSSKELMDQFSTDPNLAVQSFSNGGEFDNYATGDEGDYINGLRLMDEIDDGSFVEPNGKRYANGLELMDEVDDGSLVLPSNFTGGTQEAPGKSSKRRFGNEELGLAAAALPSMIQMAKGNSGPDDTTFEKTRPNKISLQGQRDESARQTAMARNIARENARMSGSSGRYLSNMAAMNSAITEGKIRSDLQSYLQEGTANARILNQADRINTDIKNTEIIANEKNAAMADRFVGSGMADLSQSIQGYTKDKGMSAENERYNQQVVDLINAQFSNYKWGVNPESDKAMIQFAYNKLRQNG